MYRVLMPIDTSEERALAQADYVASLPGAAERVEAYLLFVFDEETGDVPAEFDGAKSVSRIASIRTARDRLEEADVETTLFEDSGDAASDILDAAEAHDVDSIVLGGRKRSPVGKALFGSVTQSVVLNTDRPVVVTGSESE
ncbi:universal stress protein UspA [Halobiforma lacisalsi AJ5]|uniref:Universal stress protein UspA n=1 Tax=Natronobacterium lacisalsi AJ5 TaxID=358396 RepID=M0LYK9_NATLA|nr:universal stress protein [Halobiforma lacisalsi]APW97817.1 universal stress protein UspA [Halobiforma lacisalsi AJ5]EMA37434.1 UspA domain-containing protein [Halobiforma lacisalsi AJ5]